MAVCLLPREPPQPSDSHDGAAFEIFLDVRVACINNNIKRTHARTHARTQARRIVGVEYEALLQRRLSNRGVPFQTEDDLRLEGHSKTPDVRLALPVGVFEPLRDTAPDPSADQAADPAAAAAMPLGSSSSSSLLPRGSEPPLSPREGPTSAAGQWREVNWVDSKALFGNRHTWANEHLSQLEGYVHRCDRAHALLSLPQEDIAARAFLPSS